MSSIEDRLREAYRDAAGTVRPDGIRQLHEPAVTIAPPDRTPAGRPARRLLIPLAAAAAVALIGGLLAVVIPHAGTLSGPGGSGHRRTGPVAPAGSGSSHRFIVSTGRSGTALQVHNAATGASTGMLAPPVSGLIFAGAATGDGRHYVISLWRPGVCRTWLYQLTVSGAGHPGALTPFALPSLRQLLTPTALSQDNSTFAYEGEQCAAGASGASLSVVNLRTRFTKSWPIPKQADVTSLSLTADGSALAFNVDLTKLFRSAAYVLATNSAPGSALARSKVIARAARFGPGTEINGDVITPDGSKVYFTTNTTGRGYDNRWQLRVADLAARTVSVVGRYNGLPMFLIGDPRVTRALVVVQQLAAPSASATPSPSRHPGPTPSPSRHPGPTPSPSRHPGPTPSPSRHPGPTPSVSPHRSVSPTGFQVLRVSLTSGLAQPVTFALDQGSFILAW